MGDVGQRQVRQGTTRPAERGSLLSDDTQAFEDQGRAGNEAAARAVAAGHDGTVGDNGDLNYPLGTPQTVQQAFRGRRDGQASS
jgi:hypothetical protein